jgi:hypothetical protein
MRRSGLQNAIIQYLLMASTGRTEIGMCNKIYFKAHHCKIKEIEVVGCKFYA